VHPDDQSTFIKDVQQCLSGQDTRLACEVRMRCKNGEHKWILCRGAIYSRTLDSQVDRLIGTYSDISAYKGKAA
jgi:PAS domain-containing protein